MTTNTNTNTNTKTTAPVSNLAWDKIYPCGAGAHSLAYSLRCMTECGVLSDRVYSSYHDEADVSALVTAYAMTVLSLAGVGKNRETTDMERVFDSIDALVRDNQSDLAKIYSDHGLNRALFAFILHHSDTHLDFWVDTRFDPFCDAPKTRATLCGIVLRFVAKYVLFSPSIHDLCDYKIDLVDPTNYEKN